MCVVFVTHGFGVAQFFLPKSPKLFFNKFINLNYTTLKFIYKIQVFFENTTLELRTYLRITEVVSLSQGSM